MKKFEAKIRAVLAKFSVLRKENDDLYSEIEKKDEEIKSLRQQLDERTRDYNNLKLAKMIEISDTDIKESKMKITRLVREINKCINILSTGTEGSEE